MKTKTRRAIPAMGPGQRIVSTFSGREGVILAVYTRDVLVRFQDEEPIRIGRLAAEDYQRCALGC